MVQYTPRQLQILKLQIEGNPAPAIAEHLGLKTVGAIYGHMNRLRRVNGCTTDAQLVVRMIEAGAIEVKR